MAWAPQKAHIRVIRDGATGVRAYRVESHDAASRARVDELKRRIAEACTAWAADPGLYRQLQGRAPLHDEAGDLDRDLAERLAASDRLRPGGSIKEAEDVIGLLTSLPVFDRLHKSGCLSPTVVAEILVRMASAVVGESAAV